MFQKKVFINTLNCVLSLTTTSFGVKSAKFLPKPKRSYKLAFNFFWPHRYCSFRAKTNLKYKTFTYFKLSSLLMVLFLTSLLKKVVTHKNCALSVICIFCIKSWTVLQVAGCPDIKYLKELNNCTDPHSTKMDLTIYKIRLKIKHYQLQL